MRKTVARDIPILELQMQDALLLTRSSCPCMYVWSRSCELDALRVLIAWASITNPSCLTLEEMSRCYPEIV